MFGFGKKGISKREYNETSNIPEKIVITLTIIILAAVVVLCILRLVFKEEPPAKITPDDLQSFLTKAISIKMYTARYRRPIWRILPRTLTDLRLYPAGEIHLLWRQIILRRRMWHICPKMQ